MTAFVKISSIALLAFWCLAEAKYVPGISYIDNVVLVHDNATDIWRCDKLVCPADTYGCKIIKRNNPNRADELICNNICYDKEGKNLVKLTQTKSMVKAKTIDIYINSYVGAVSLWSTGYSLSWQGVNATIAAGDFPELQESTRRIMKEVDESNAPWQKVIGTF